MLKVGRLWALGAMSGTSLDGVDAAMVQTDGETIYAFGQSRYQAYSAKEQAVLRDALGKWPGEDLDAASEVVKSAHLAVLKRFRRADLVGFHGQTLAHDPRGKGTHQLGDGAALAKELGMPVVWDFRSADVKLRGEGAPLAPFFHFACAKWIGAETPLAFLNLGGVGNLTWVDPRMSKPEADGALLAFDTGPANAPINDAMLQRRGQPFDRDGSLAWNGKVDEPSVAEFMKHPYFDRVPPKSLDRDQFHGLFDLAETLSDADAIATLTAMSAVAVWKGMQHCPAPPERLLVTGGGRKNTTVMKMLQEAMTCPVEPIETVGLNGDMLEAQAFAHLAVRVARGLPTSCPNTTGVSAAVSGGILSQPA